MAPLDTSVEAARRPWTILGRRAWLGLVALALPASASAQAGREISATLTLTRDEVAGGPVRRTIAGDGHTHVVEVSGAALAELWDHGHAVARSGPARDGHRHWVRVRLS